MNFAISSELLAATFPKHKLPSNVVETWCEHLIFNAGDLLLIRDLINLAKDDSNDLLLLLILLADAANTGSLCLPLEFEYLNKKFQRLDFVRQSGITKSVTTKNEAIESLLNVAARLPQSICGETSAEDKLLIRQNNKLYFHKYAKSEACLQHEITVLLKDKRQPSLDSHAVRGVVGEILASTKYSLAPMQVLALVNTLHSPFSIISGGPGTGKTTIMAAVLRGLMRLGVISSVKDIELAAPTGRAAKRMTEALKNGIEKDITAKSEEDIALLSLESQTLHRLLGANPMRDQFKYHAGNLLRAKVIVVDEVSMVDIVMMSRFIQAVPKDCKIIFLGDQYQLPSVDAGAVLSDLMPPLGKAAQYSAAFSKTVVDSLPSCNDLQMQFSEDSLKEIRETLAVHSESGLMLNRVTILNKPQRCQEDIQAFSQFIKLGEVNQGQNFLSSRKNKPTDNAFKWPEAEGMYHICPESALSADQWKTLYLSWFERYFMGQESNSFLQQVKHLDIDFEDLEASTSELTSVFSKIFENRILCAVRSGPYGADTINYHICKRLKLSLPSGAEERFHGSIIMISENDKSRDLYNGDTGLLIKDKASQQLRAVFQHGEGFRSFSIHALPAFKSAFAMTVHKSQGSEFERILMALPDNKEHQLLTREILYTGLTRAKKQACLFATDACLEAGIARKVERHSGMNFYG